MIHREPVMAAFVAFLIAGCAVLVSFGVHLTQTQIDAVRTMVETGFVLALLVRSRVTPQRKAT